MAEEYVDMEYISLHGYIRNTPSDAELHAEHQLRVDRSTWSAEKNVQNHAKLNRIKTLGGKTGVLLVLGGWGNWSRSPIPILGQLSESEEKDFRLRVKQLICGSLNRMRIRQSLPQPYTPQAGMKVPWNAQRLRAGVWGLWSNPRVRAAFDCGETDQGEVREEIARGNAWGGKPGSHGSKAILLSHA